MSSSWTLSLPRAKYRAIFYPISRPRDGVILCLSQGNWFCLKLPPASLRKLPEFPALHWRLALLKSYQLFLQRYGVTDAAILYDDIYLPSQVIVKDGKRSSFQVCIKH